MRLPITTGWLCALTLLSVGAFADLPGKEGDKEPHGPASATAAHGDKDRPHAVRKDDDDHDDKGKRDDRDRDRDRREDKQKVEKDDDDRPTPGQEQFRRGLLERRQKAIAEEVGRGHKTLTEEEREAISGHWHRMLRLLRIRLLAEKARDDAAVKRVDALLDRIDKALDTKLDKLNAAAPAAAGGAQ
jgi:hypothetical protein